MALLSDNINSMGCLSRLFKRRRASKSLPQEHLPSSSTSDSSLAYKTSSIESDKDGKRCQCICPTCDFSFGEQSLWWKSESIATLPPYSPVLDDNFCDATKSITQALDGLGSKLREISLKIHQHPEIQFKEKFAHDILSSFMEDHGFKVSRQYLGLSTAWRAEFSHGKGGRVLGVNSEMDALLGLGHACGHNLIAVSGCGIAITLKAALEATNTPGKIILLGTPAEEAGGGKIILLDRGGYDEMDLCLMCHPGPGPTHSFDVGSTNAMQNIDVEFFGRSAHAGAAPWEGTNALDAAFLAYSSISVLRQQMKPDHRVHGVIQGKDWSPNAKEFKAVIKDHYLMETTCRGSTASTDFVSLPRPSWSTNQLRLFDDREMLAIDSLHSIRCSVRVSFLVRLTTAFTMLYSIIAIPTEPNGGNHTPAFARSAATLEAHEAAMVTTRALALTGFRAMRDESFFQEVSTSVRVFLRRPLTTGLADS
ncbi:hypothetical protein PQX77_001279 [Marasmius sp. AFHP31]|nr:hypothetical protein PQX77_001279 [Marasmius sp. AFHP31]